MVAVAIHRTEALPINATEKAESIFKNTVSGEWTEVVKFRHADEGGLDRGVEARQAGTCFPQRSGYLADSVVTGGTAQPPPSTL